MLSIAVCDDEILDCCKIAGAVKKILEEAGVSCIVRQFNSGQEVLKAIEGYDIIFLDILMHGLDGMETARLLRERAFEKIIIFISSSRKYVFEAYDVEAFHYLVKPVDGYKLKNILKRVVKRLEHHREEFLIVNKERQRKKMDEVLQNKVKNWYRMLTASLLFIVLIFDVVNWGASNGIMVVSNASGAEYWDIYYNQIFSHIGICLLAALSMCIAAGLVFGGNKIYVEQRQKEQYFSQIAYYKMLQEQYAQMERLRHDMKNHVLSLYGLWGSKEYEKAGSYLRKMLERGNIASADEVTGNRYSFWQCPGQCVGIMWQDGGRGTYFYPYYVEMCKKMFADRGGKHDKYARYQGNEAGNGPFQY